MISPARVREGSAVDPRTPQLGSPRSPPAVHRTNVLRPGSACRFEAFVRGFALHADCPHGAREEVKLTLDATHRHRVSPVPHPPVRHFHSTR